MQGQSLAVALPRRLHLILRYTPSKLRQFVFCSVAHTTTTKYYFTAPCRSASGKTKNRLQCAAPNKVFPECSCTVQEHFGNARNLPARCRKVLYKNKSMLHGAAPNLICPKASCMVQQTFGWTFLLPAMGPLPKFFSPQGEGSRKEEGQPQGQCC